MTSPPLPPLPPSGPPRGLNFSRCTETQPWPPEPPDTCRTTRSTKLATWISLMLFPRRARTPKVDCNAVKRTVERATWPAPPLQIWLLLCSCSSNDVHYATTAAGAEFNSSRGQCEQGVVAATANTGARVEVGAALADDDLAGRNDLAAEALYAEVLGVGVTTVASGAR